MHFPEEKDFGTADGDQRFVDDRRARATRISRDVAYLEGRETATRMDEENIARRLQAIEERLNEVHRAVERTRRYILAMLIVAGVGFLLPLVGLVFAIPAYLSTLQELSGF